MHAIWCMGMGVILHIEFRAFTFNISYSKQFDYKNESI